MFTMLKRIQKNLHTCTCTTMALRILKSITFPQHAFIKFVQRDKKENQCKARTRDPYSLTDWATRKVFKFRLNENYKWKVIFIGFLFKGIKYVK